jgi:hypothetical protein
MLKKPSGVWIVAYTTIDNPELYFQTVLWSGDSNSPRTITFDGSEDMQPDWIWSKKRNSADYGQIYDSVRTFGAGKEIVPSDNFEEGNSTNNSTALGYISSVTSDGFVLTEGNHGTSSIRSLLNNHSGSTHVAWGWKAGGSASSNTDGSATSTVSANTTAGFSIVSYTGNETAKTIGHGLGAIPQIVITKNRSTTGQWAMYNRNLGANKNLHLETTDAAASSSAVFNDTESTSSVFSVGNAVMTNDNGSNFIAYCFAEKKGYSKFGSYTGNGSSSDGTFVYTGFRPAWVLIKRTNASGHDWVLIDSKRLGYNADNNTLLPNSTAVEATDNRIDILSNGFKNYNANGSENESGGEYIYLAFAENPFVNSSGIPCNAR